MQKLGNYFVGMTLLLAFIMVGLVTYWMVWPYKPVTFHNNPFPIVGLVVRGEPLKFYMEFTRHLDIPVTVVARFTDTLAYSVPAMMFHKPVGEYKYISTNYKMPESLPAGKYRLELCFTYEVNPIRTVVVHARTQEFDVK